MTVVPFNPPTETPTTLSNDEINAEIARLATLAPAVYGRERKAAAKRLGTGGVTWLDKAVEAERRKIEALGRAPFVTEPEPWPEPVDGAVLIYELATALLRYVVMEDDEAIAIALWVVHTYVFDLFTITPRLSVESPVMGCGKSTLLDIIVCLVTRALNCASLTASVVFRAVDMCEPTLVFDEADRFFKRKGDAAVSDVEAVLNSGYRRGGRALRNVGDDHTPTAFSTFCPVAFGIIGRLPPTIEDRAIRIQLKRKPASEKTESFSVDRTDDLQALARKIRRWTDDHQQALTESDPDMPEELGNRAADNWKVLFAIADLCGAVVLGNGRKIEWRAEARRIAVREVEVEEENDDSIAKELLADVRTLFENKVATDMIWSDDLAAYLNGLELRPWSDWKKPQGGTGITPKGVAKLLKPFGIKPEPLRGLFLGREVQKRGYQRKAFEDAWQRYLKPAAGPRL